MHCIDADEVYGGYLAAQHLLECGYKKFAYVGSWHNVKVCLDRQKGFEDGLAEGGARIEPSHIYYIREQEFETIVDSLVQDDIDGIFCFNDIIAFIIIEALEGRGKELGKDYGIVGCDNIQFMMRMPRLLTTIDVGCEAFAEAGARLMLHLLSGNAEELPTFRSTHRSFLVKGKSTR